jgi:hypothetical protein
MRGLSVHQAPPFQVIALYFSTACVFWFLSSLLELFLFFKRELNLPLLVHSHVVGFALMTMLGALFQMLPVVAGAVIPEPLKKAIPIYLALLLSSLLFLGGFLLKKERFLLFGATLLMLSIISAVSLMLYYLLPKKSFVPAVRGFKFSLLFLLIATISGYLFLTLKEPLFFKIHYSFMLWGWIGGLIASVSFQVIELFYTTPPYPKFFAWHFHILVSFFLLFSLLGASFPYRLPLSILYIIYALITVYLLLKSKRRVLEYTPKFWLLGMGLLLLASIFFVFGEFLAFLVSFGLFFSSIILGMMQRIVPFLVWFHLSGFGLKDAPLMFEIIPPRRQAITFYSFLILCLSIPFALISTDFLIVSIILHLFTASVLLFNVLSGIGIYLKYVKQSL